jgi:crossover junction endodeoxyribonuclease RusA
MTSPKRRRVDGFSLPWPDSRLSPNGRHDRRRLTDVRAIARNIGWAEAMQSGLRVPDRTPLHLFLTFYPPDNRRRDGDNLIGAFKYYQDGIFKALGVDDSNIKLTTFGIGRKMAGGLVDVRIEVIRPAKAAGC